MKQLLTNLEKKLKLETQLGLADKSNLISQEIIKLFRQCNQRLLEQTDTNKKTDVASSWITVAQVGHDYYPRGNVYCATKHAVKAIRKSLRIDLLGAAIRVSEMDPGSGEPDFFTLSFFTPTATRTSRLAR